MSVIKDSKYGFFISHESLINEIYSKISNCESSYRLKPEIFNIYEPFKKPKGKQIKQDTNQVDPFETEVERVKELYSLFYAEIGDVFSLSNFEVRNNALETATSVYDQSGENRVCDLHGENPDSPTVKIINNSKFLFPENCKFYSKDVRNIGEFLQGQKYDLILLDPPWWNKYIRRKRKHTDHGYEMMYNEDLLNLPLENYLKTDSLVAVWCTNSSQHLAALKNDFFPKWGIRYLAKWYWVKVTKLGVPICEFSKPPRKQPFEQIVFGCKEGRNLPNPPSDKLVVSVPSALHSHKPPLTSIDFFEKTQLILVLELLQCYLPSEPQCLEIFARYLLPNWTSYGNEVLRFQHESLYVSK